MTTLLINGCHFRDQHHHHRHHSLISADKWMIICCCTSSHKANSYCYTCIIWLVDLKVPLQHHLIINYSNAQHFKSKIESPSTGLLFNEVNGKPHTLLLKALVSGILSAQALLSFYYHCLAMVARYYHLLLKRSMKVTSFVLIFCSAHHRHQLSPNELFLPLYLDLRFSNSEFYFLDSKSSTSHSSHSSHGLLSRCH